MTVLSRLSARGVLQVLLALIALALAYWFVPPLFRSTTGCHATFSVTTANIGIEYAGSVPPKNLDEVAAWARSAGRPEILVLQEVQGLVKGRDLADRLDYPYFVDGRALGSRTAQIILSDFQIAEANDLDFDRNNQGDAALCAALEIASRIVLVCSIHLRTPAHELLSTNDGRSYPLGSLLKLALNEVFSSDTPRMVSTRKLLNWMKGRSWDAAVIAGDFNTIPIGRPIRLMSESFDDSMWQRAGYFRGTKISSKGLPIRPRIDYVFHTGGLLAMQSEVLDQSIGDHLPVSAELALCIE